MIYCTQPTLANVLQLNENVLAKPSAWFLKTLSCCQKEIIIQNRSNGSPSPTFEMEQDVRAIVLEHLSNELDIDVLNVDLLSPPYLH
jgi:hypothetical protein